jgi:hypothetical protein
MMLLHTVAASKRMFRRRGCRFADKTMCHSRIASHFQATLQQGPVPFDRTWAVVRGLEVPTDVAASSHRTFKSKTMKHETCWCPSISTFISACAARIGEPRNRHTRAFSGKLATRFSAQYAINERRSSAFPIQLGCNAPSADLPRPANSNSDGGPDPIASAPCLPGPPWRHSGTMIACSTFSVLPPLP